MRIVSVTLPPIRGSVWLTVKLCGRDAFGLLNFAIVSACSNCRILPRKLSLSCRYCPWPCGRTFALTGSGCLFLSLPIDIDGGGKEKKTPISYSLSAGRMTWSWLLGKSYPIWMVSVAVSLKATLKGAVFAYHRWNATFFTIDPAVCICLCLECLQPHSDLLCVSLCVCSGFFFLLRCRHGISVFSCLLA